MTAKTPFAVHPALRDDIGDLLTRRPLPGPGLDQIDPFLFLNHHGPQIYPPNNRGLPFGPHPHRGFETVTFILDGELAHRDSAGHESVIRKGGVQWMTAGSGLVHAEVSPDAFMRSGGPLEILQLWVNLPARLKMTQPRYVGMQQQQIPAVDADDGRATVELISGRWNGRIGPIESLTDVFLCIVRCGDGAGLRFDALEGRSLLLYVVRGELRANGLPVRALHLARMSTAGDTLELEALADSVVLLGHAEPIGEPVVAQGPFVMNTRQQIVEAVRDYRAGRFDTVSPGD